MKPADRHSTRLRAIYDRVAPLYDSLDFPFETWRYRAIRPEVFAAVADARHLLDCAIGTGRNIPYYPADAQMTGFDLSPAMLARARRRSTRLGRAVELLEADILDLPFADGRFCAATATFLFCVLPDEVQDRALREVARVVKPGGRIVLLEYTWSQNPFHRWLMKLWVPWIRFAFGAGFGRRTRDHAVKAGLIIEDESYLYRDIIRRLTLRRPETL